MSANNSKHHTSEISGVASTSHKTTRRRLLKTAATACAVAGFSNTTAAQIEDSERTSDSPVSIDLAAGSSIWIGRSPGDIEGEYNPTLELSPGQTYRLTWENIVGHPHDLEILSDEGEVLVGTDEYVYEKGATETLEFEATEEMDEYRTSTGAQSFAMVGDIQFPNTEE